MGSGWATRDLDLLRVEEETVVRCGKCLNIMFVSRTLGHSDAAITLRVYGHLFDREAHADRARAAMDAAIGATA